MDKSPKPLSEILVPMDFSECSRRALQCAMRIAASSNARLHLLAVGDDPMLMAPTTHQSYRDEYEDGVTKQFTDLIAEELGDATRPITAVRIGTAYNEIETYAEENGIELIVMGTLGRSPLADLLLGSVASHVVRYACCPVLTVK